MNSGKGTLIGVDPTFRESTNDCLMFSLNKKQRILCVVIRNFRIIPNRISNGIESNVSMSRELFGPILRPLLVGDMICAALIGYGGAKQNSRGSVKHKKGYKTFRSPLWQMLCHFQRLHQIELSINRRW